MSLKLNNTSGNTNTTQDNGSFVKDTGEAKTGRKLFQNKAANRALIIVGAILGVVLIGCLVLLAIPIG